MTLVLPHNEIFSDTFHFTAILTSQRKGALTPGAPLDSLMLDPITGKCYSELIWQERPYTRPIFAFVKQHVEEL
ncbi:MAG: hypothetical protein HZB51_32110 [Chloroflexi bacterium]|nr:hypothetical protein [Chloroflexota bacterium]